MGLPGREHRTLVIVAKAKSIVPDWGSKLIPIACGPGPRGPHEG